MIALTALTQASASTGRATPGKVHTEKAFTGLLLMSIELLHKGC